MEINEEKRRKFMEYAGKRVNNVMHDIQILEPMARSSAYDFTKEDVEEMFVAMQEVLNNTKAEFNKKFEEKARTERKVFSFGTSSSNVMNESTNITTAVASMQGQGNVEQVIDNVVDIQNNNENNTDINV